MKFPIAACATLTFCFCGVLSTPVVAQTQEQPGQAEEQTAQPGPGAQKAAKVAQILNLSPTQKSQLTPILEAEAPKVQAINQDPNLSPSEKAEKLKAVHAQTDPLVKSILTPTQYKQWQVIRRDEMQMQ
jgi:hypothetical protein